MMLIQSASVIGILMGRDSGWAAQRRDDGTLPWRDVMRRYGRHTLFGLVLALAAYEVSFSLFAWMTPVIVGLILAIPLAQWTASPAAGRLLRRIGLLVAPGRDEPAGRADARQRTRRAVQEHGRGRGAAATGRRSGSCSRRIAPCCPRRRHAGAATSTSRSRSALRSSPTARA